MLKLSDWLTLRDLGRIAVLVNLPMAEREFLSFQKLQASLERREILKNDKETLLNFASFLNTLNMIPAEKIVRAYVNKMENQEPAQTEKYTPVASTIREKI